jgi:hypothetical protein
METVEYQRTVVELLENILAAQIRIEGLQEQVLAVDQKILAALTTDTDIANLGGSISKPEKQ